MDPDLTALCQTIRELGPDNGRRFAQALIEHGTATASTDWGRAAVYIALGRIVATTAAHQAHLLATLDDELNLGGQP